MTANLSVTASFAINTFTLTYTAGANGSITGTTPQTVNYNASGSAVTAVPATGYHFTSWSDGVLTATRTDASVTANLSVTASFAINSYRILVSVAGGGQVTPSGTQVVTYDNWILLNFWPDTGRRVGNVIVDGVAMGPLSSYTFSNVRSNHTISVVFDDANHLTVVGFPNALGSVAPGQVFGKPGDCVRLYITPNRGYHVTDVLINGTSTGTSGTEYTIASLAVNSLVTAMFAPNAYTVTTSVLGGGQVSPASVQTVNYGMNKVFAFIPDSGNSVLDVLVDGRSVGAVTSYTLLGTQADHLIQVKFGVAPF